MTTQTIKARQLLQSDMVATPKLGYTMPLGIRSLEHYSVNGVHYVSITLNTCQGAILQGDDDITIKERILANLPAETQHCVRRVTTTK